MANLKRSALSALTVCAVCTTTPAYAADKYLDIQHITTDKGISAWLVEDHSVPVIAMTYAFENAGAKNDPADKQGLSRLASNTMDEGAGDLSSQEFQKTLRDLSISLTFSAGRDHFSGKLKTLTRNKDKAFNLLNLALTKPRFDAEAVDRMRASNVSRVKSSISNPKWIAARLQNDHIFEGHPYALNSGGTLTSLAAITSDDLREFHTRLGKNQLTIAVAGDITADELKTHLDTTFNGLPDVSGYKVEQKPLQNAGQNYLYKKDIPQSVIEISQKGISRQDESYYSTKLMNFILGESGFGSRLMEEIREKRGLTYGIYSYFRDYEEMDVFHISTSTANDNVGEMIGLITAELEKIKNTPVTADELADAKSYIVGSLPLSLTSTDSIASTMLSMQLDDLPIDYLDTRATQFNAVTIDGIQKAAKNLLDVNTLTTIMVGQPQGLGDDFKITEIKTLPNVE